MIPVNSVSLTPQDLANVSEAVETGWISSSGRFIEEFETSWATYCGRRWGVAVSNGTTALQLALAALRPNPGAEIVMPSFTIMSCALAAVYNDCVPVLVDVDPETWCLDVDQVKDKLTERTFAVMPVHMYGHPADMDPLLEMTAELGVHVVEDAAQSHGAEYLADRSSSAPEWRRCGGFGTVSSFSFYANKPVTTGEGGMVLTDDEELADRARGLRNLAFRKDRRFVHDELGFNFRLTNVQAALGVGQIGRIEQIVRRKREIGRAYAARLRDLESVRLPVERDWARSIYWMFGLVVSEETGLDAAEVAVRLEQRGVETRPFFTGLHEQPVLTRRGLFAGEAYPVTQRLARQGLYLPSGLGLTDDEIERVCDAVEEVLR